MAYLASQAITHCRPDHSCQHLTEKIKEKKCATILTHFLKSSYLITKYKFILTDDWDPWLRIVEISK